MPWGWWYWPRGWWCPRHPWPPAWARAYYPWRQWYSPDPSEELRILEDLKEDLERQLSEISTRIEELRRSLEGRK